MDDGEDQSLCLSLTLGWPDSSYLEPEDASKSKDEEDQQEQAKMKKMKMTEEVETILDQEIVHPVIHIDDDDDGKNEDEEGRWAQSLACKYCQREFCTAKALGGHQNAHKEERAKEKGHARGRIIKTIADGSSSSSTILPDTNHPYSPIPMPMPMAVGIPILMFKPRATTTTNSYTNSTCNGNNDNRSRVATLAPGVNRGSMIHKRAHSHPDAVDAGRGHGGGDGGGDNFIMPTPTPTPTTRSTAAARYAARPRPRPNARAINAGLLQQMMLTRNNNQNHNHNNGNNGGGASSANGGQVAYEYDASTGFIWMIPTPPGTAGRRARHPPPH